MKPTHASALMSSMPASASVGKSGNKGERSPLATASALTLPALTWGITAAAGRSAMSTSPEITAIAAAPEPP